MQFLLGIRNRQVYSKFTTFEREDGSVYIRSTDYNRTIESALSQMQGFFPPGSAELIANTKTRATAHPFIDDPHHKNWTVYNKWLGMRSLKMRVETTPVHLFARSNPFNQWAYHPYTCQPYYGMSQANIASPLIQNFINMTKVKYGKPLMELAGQNTTDFLGSYWYLFGMFDSFISDMYDGRDLQKAIDAGIDLQDFNKTSFQFAKNDILTQFNGDKESFFARWTASILWPEVISWMERRMAADRAGDFSYFGYQKPRFAFFSTHDVTVGSGLTVLHRAFGTPLYYTPFASDIFFELHMTKEGAYKVHIKYQSLTMKVVGFAEFKEKLEKQFMTREEIAKACGWDLKMVHDFLPQHFTHGH